MLAMLLTSCMGEGGDPIIMGVQPGVVKLMPKKSIYLKDGTIITSSKLEAMDVEDGNCCLVDFKTNRLDIGTGKTADVDIIRYESVPKWTVIPEMQDTITIQRNERFLSLSIAQSAYVLDELFLFAEVGNHRAGQTNEFYLSYDPKQKAQMIDNKKVYQLYLRAIGEKDTSAKPSIIQKILPNAFTIRQFVKDISATEGINGKGELTIRFKYPQSFNNDTTKYIWSTSDLFTFLVNTDNTVIIR